MAKLGSSSSCRPLLQAGMMLLALLLLASIQAALVMAASLEQGAEVFEELRGKVLDQGRKKGPETVANMGLTAVGKNWPGLKDLTDGAKWGIKVHKYWCRAQGLMDKLNPGGRPYLVEIVATSGNGGGDLSMSFPACPSGDQPQQVPTAAGTAPLVPSRITGILVGQEEVKLPVQIPAAPVAYLEETSLYGRRLKDAVDLQMKLLNGPGATRVTSFPPNAAGADDNLCYTAASSLSLRLPGIAILHASDNAAMPTMEQLWGGATGTAWVSYPLSSKFCLLGIRRMVEALIPRRP